MLFNRTPISRVLFSLTICLMQACGGGGGGDSSGGASSPTALYQGNTNPASITKENAVDVASAVFGARDLVTLTVAKSLTGSTTTNGAGVAKTIPLVLDTLRHVNAKVVEGARVSTRRVAKQVVDEVIPGDISGNVKTTGNLSDAGVGTLTMKFSDYDDGYGTLTGTATVTFNQFDRASGLDLQSQYQFTNLVVMLGAIDITLDGIVDSEIELASREHTMQASLLLTDNETAESLKVEDLSLLLVYDNLPVPSGFTQLLTGRIYDSVEGYVDIDTTASLLYETYTQAYPSSGGPVLIEGADSRTIRVTPLSSQRAEVALQSAENATFEVVGELN